MTVNEFLAANPTGKGGPRPHIICEDKTLLSVQASHGACSYPQKNNSPVYLAVEVMVKPELVPDWSRFEEDPGYGLFQFVPVELVDKFIEAHGGIRGKSW